MLTTHQSNERYGQELVIADPDIQALMQGDSMENGFGSEGNLLPVGSESHPIATEIGRSGAEQSKKKRELDLT